MSIKLQTYLKFQVTDATYQPSQAPNCNCTIATEMVSDCEVLMFLPRIVIKDVLGKSRNKSNKSRGVELETVLH